MHGPPFFFKQRSDRILRQRLEALPSKEELSARAEAPFFKRQDRNVEKTPRLVKIWATLLGAQGGDEGDIGRWRSCLEVLFFGLLA